MIPAKAWAVAGIAAAAWAAFLLLVTALALRSRRAAPRRAGRPGGPARPGPAAASAGARWTHDLRRRMAARQHHRRLRGGTCHRIADRELTDWLLDLMAAWADPYTMPRH